MLPSDTLRNLDANDEVARLALISAFQDIEENEDGSSPIALGPSDSHYELPIVTAGDDDSQDNLPELDADMPFDAPVDSDAIIAAAASSGLLARPWYFRFLHAWSRYYFLFALGIGILALAALGFFLIRALVIGHTFSSAIAALVLAAVGLVAYVLLSVTATALYFLLLDLARNTRAWNVRADLNTTIASD
jgi:hypothetical protein